jgi:hypothetical protein
MRPGRAVLHDQAAGREAGPTLPPPGMAPTAAASCCLPGSAFGVVPGSAFGVVARTARPPGLARRAVGGADLRVLSPDSQQEQSACIPSAPWWRTWRTWIGCADCLVVAVAPNRPPPQLATAHPGKMRDPD